MDYVLEGSYFTHMLSRIEEQDKMNAYIEECMILSEGKHVVSKLITLNEDLGDKMRARWEAFTQFVARLWAKFVENITRILNTELGYVEKYKDIIINKKMKPVTISMREYNVGLQRIATVKVPAFATSLLANIPTDPNDIKFKTSLIRDYKDNQVQFVDYCVQYFEGGEQLKDFTEHTINMTDIYNFCRDKNAILSNIQKDQTVLQNSTKAVEAEYKNRISSAQNPQQQDKTKDQGTGEVKTKVEPEVQQQNTNNGKVESAYSRVYGIYLTEADSGFTIKPGADASATAPPASQAAVQPQDPNNLKNTTAAGGIDKSTQAGETNAQKDQNLKGADLDTFAKQVQIYQTTCMDVIKAKMTAVTVIFKDYMKIIRAHVQSYVGTDNNNDNTAAKTGTNYNNGVQLTDDQKTQLNGMITLAEAPNQDPKAQQDAQAKVVQQIKTYVPNFSGDYAAAKQLTGWKPKQ